MDNLEDPVVDDAAHDARSLLVRTQKVINAYDAEIKDYAFGDSGDAEMYANQFKKLLQEWMK